jgi:hypothetical protein
MMNIAIILFEILNWIIYVYIAITAVYIFIFAIGGLMPLRKRISKDNLKRKFNSRIQRG